MKFLVLLPLAFALLCPWYLKANSSEKVIIATARSQHVFMVELAVTPDAHQRGLMYRREMPRNAGMLFIFSTRGPKSFWMKNTLIPLDILFLEAGGRIIHVHHNAQPHSLTPISPKVKTLAVLEINGGLSEELGIKVGDLVLHSKLRGR